MNDSLDLSIVVLNYNTSDLLEGALQSICKTAGALRFDVTVIDNASSDGGFSRVSETLKGDSRFSFIQNEHNTGWAAINRMLKTKGKYIVTLDPDAVLHDKALESLVSFMDAHSQAGAAAAKLLNLDGTPQWYYRRIMTPVLCFFTTVMGRVVDKYMLNLWGWKRYRYEDLNLSVVSEVEQPAWPCLLWRREAVREYIVDEHIPFYFVDVDMSRRVYDGGYKIYLVPDAQITHLKSTSFGKRDEAWRRREYYRSLVYYFKKHYPYHLPLIWSMLWCDRMLRAFMRFTLGREPLR